MQCSEGGVESVRRCVHYEQQMIRWVHDRKMGEMNKETGEQKYTL